MSQRLFVKLSLHEAVRYKPQDPVENWLDSLLFLDVPLPPTDPKAYGTLKMARFLEIDTRSSSPLLFAVMGLLRGHYRTSPNDLARLVSDPHIRTFALVANEGAGPPAVAVVAIEETPERLGKSGAKVHQTHLLANGLSFANGVPCCCLMAGESQRFGIQTIETFSRIPIIWCIFIGWPIVPCNH